MLIRSLLLAAAIAIALAACKQVINPSALYGNWRYVKLDHPKSDDPTDTLSTAELAAASPYISFTDKNELKIYWAGKIISHGKFSTAANNINYTEYLPDGTMRTFPFYVSRLDSKTIVFETLDKKDATRVMAIKN